MRFNHATSRLANMYFKKSNLEIWLSCKYKQFVVYKIEKLPVKVYTTTKRSQQISSYDEGP